jgi:hypothetical protein
MNEIELFRDGIVKRIDIYRELKEDAEKNWNLQDFNVFMNKIVIQKMFLEQIDNFIN